ncbi:MAG: nitroreductase family deazaflavin-dependent oxidoreductase [Anaerolineae bacterium]|nr:nitroreductase family deazaflavin-dependent oxidoreductase [Anaerolineae bacterium]
MDEKIARALATDRTIDITTVGRKSGQPRRIEIWFHNLDGEIYITGTPGTRDWYANMVANHDITFHLKNTTKADIPATVEPITEPGQRRPILERITRNVGRSEDIEKWMTDSPLVLVHLRQD